MAKALEVSEQTSTAGAPSPVAWSPTMPSACGSSALLALPRDRNKPLWTSAEDNSPHG